MNRDRLVVVGVAVLAVLALGAGAAAIDAPLEAGTGAGVGGGSSGGFGGGSSFDLGQPAPPADGPALPTIVFRIAVVVLVATFLVSLYLLRDEIGLRQLKLVAGLAVVVGVVLTGVYYLLQLSNGPNAANATGGALGQSRRSLPGGGGEGTVDAVTHSFSPGPLLALGLLVVLLLGVAAVVRRGGDDETAPETGAREPTELTDLGRAAGRAADRIAADGSTENEVYRAWREMADHVDVANPRASTPVEFARAAADAGMADEDVDELTRLFSTVRYGGGSVTADRERRAVAALRRIEDAYTEDS